MCVRILAASCFLAALPARGTADDQAALPTELVIKVSAKRFEYSPSVIKVKVNTPVVLELTSLDRKHGFAVPDFKVDAELKPGEVTRVRFVPDKTGTFEFHCSVFCGSGHEEMSGQLVVTN